ncbi:glycosyltransferase family 2 protein [Vibrio sp. TRT 1302]|uniref:glycosyltransferase family 2 protein n=1 Tax=Vibrio sp. TRT 1302 TaxID=3418504 RepID=UPI003CE9D651
MALFISVINHNHDDMICDNPTLRNLAKEHTVIIKSNTLASQKLTDYCSSSLIHLIQGQKTKGFGANNNEVFHYAEHKLGMAENDHFLVLNPDVEVANTTINKLLVQSSADKCAISTINLFRNREMTKYDNSIRHFPSLLNPIKSLLKIKNTNHYDKDKICRPTQVDWAAGSFLLFKSGVYKNLGGFNEEYFMYFEDVDICKRASEQLHQKLTYFPQYKAIHFAQHSNRNILSKTFLFYMKSYFLYFRISRLPSIKKLLWK